MDKPIKNYLLPTNKWLKPIKLLAKTLNQIFDAEMIENEIKKRRVIVKVTKSSETTSHSKSIYSIIGKLPHIIKIYNFISCYENPVTIKQNYIDALGFCEGGPIDTLNNMINKKANYQTIHLEIMKKYNGSLNEFIEELSLNKTIKLLIQAIYIQLELFCACGFIHGDIHLGNFLIEKTDNKKREFSFCGNIKQLEIFVNLYLTDFEHSIIYSQKANPDIKSYMSNPKVLILSNTIGGIIINTFTEFIHLLKDTELQNILSEKIGKWKETNIHINDSKFVKQLFSYANHTISEYLFISKSYENGLQLASELFKLLFNIDF